MATWHLTLTPIIQMTYTRDNVVERVECRMSIFEELKRRNVFKVAIAYLVASWLILQMTEVLTELLALEQDVGKLVILFLIIGFIPAVMFAWAFEMTPEGIRKEKDVDRSQSITHNTGRKLDFAIIAGLVVIAGYFIWEARFAEQGSEQFSQESAAKTVASRDEKMDPTPTDAPITLDDNSIAVLPFANRSNLDGDQFFTDGIHDDLLTQLAKIDDLKVISRTSVMEYRDTTKKISEIARELGVSKILEGGVQRAGKRIRINAQLIDVATDKHLWAETFDREMTIDNIFDIQTEITRRIVEAVRGELTPEERDAISERPTNNLQAWEAYIQARSATMRPDYLPANYIEAEPWARRAVELDPEFADAWALLATISTQAIWMGYDNTPERRREIREIVDTAISLAPGSPAVLAMQADYQYRMELDYQGAHDFYRQSLALEPGNAITWLYLAITERRLGLWEESLLSFQRAADLDPANEFVATQLIDTLTNMNAWERVAQLADHWILRNPASADLKCYKVQALIYGQGDLQAARTFLDLTPPSQGAVYFTTAANLARLERDYDRLTEMLTGPGAAQFSQFSMGLPSVMLGWAHKLNGNEEEARWQLEKHIRDYGDLQGLSRVMEGFRLAGLAYSYAGLDDMESALAAIEASSNTLSREQDHLFGAITHMGQTALMARAGQRDEALDRLAENIDGPEGYSRWELYLDPGWDFFRDDERFNDLARPLNLKEDQH